MKLTAAQTDRAAGTLLGMAAGDALGADYEFGPALPDAATVTMSGSNRGWEPGEWTDDTAMAVPIAQAAARGDSLADPATLGWIFGRWVEWSTSARDVGVHTSQVLRQARAATETAATDAALAVHRAAGKSAGNGSLMRTAPVALAYLDSAEAVAAAARRVSGLTHYEDDAGDACVIWCLAIRHAVLTGEYDVRTGIDALPADRRARWHGMLDEAEAKHPRDFPNNGWVVQALQGAWSAISHGEGLVDTLERAVRGGHDTDTVAAIAGALAGARWGASAVPTRWRRLVHGWPGLRARDLVALGVAAAQGGHPAPESERIDYRSYGDISTLVRHPHDDGVWLGAVGALDRLPAEVDAVVSLCRVGRAQTTIVGGNHVEIRLIDNPDPTQNPNLEFVLADAADAVAQFRAEGRTVLLHCVQAQSRTPSVAALYAARHLGVPIDRAFAEVVAALPAARPKRFLVEAVRRVATR